MINSTGHEVEADLAGRPALLRDASARALAYLGGLTDRPVAPATEQDIDRSVAAVTACATC